MWKQELLAVATAEAAQIKADSEGALASLQEEAERRAKIELNKEIQDMVRVTVSRCSEPDAVN